MGSQTTTQNRAVSISSTGSIQTISSGATFSSHRSATTPRKLSIWALALDFGLLTVREEPFECHVYTSANIITKWLRNIPVLVSLEATSRLFNLLGPRRILMTKTILGRGFTPMPTSSIPDQSYRQFATPYYFCKELSSKMIIIPHLYLFCEQGVF
jgi:hypothetical protein